MHGFSVCAGPLSCAGAAPQQGLLGASRGLVALSAVTASASSAEAAEELELVSAAALLSCLLPALLLGASV